VTLADGRYVEYGYTSGRLTSVRNPRGKTWTLAYDANGRLSSIQDPVGR
jgi:YD repeat-containing protein